MLRRVALAVVVIAFLAGSIALPSAYADGTATLTGRILDPNGLPVPDARVQAVSETTGVAYPTVTNREGFYTLPALPPSTYRIIVDKAGFKQIVKTDVTLHVEDVAALNFDLQVGSTSETVTVNGSGLVINTTDAAVGTVVDHNFVENMPLNGRSFQDLILLTPGVVTNTPQAQQGVGTTGEFSVNGQRTESNYYVVDGASANTAASIGFLYFPSASGAVAASTALGTTQAIVSVDALQEFRVQSSSYSAEYGRYPGGQFSFVTRSGANQWHGSAFDYLRNNVFDANDWFNDYRAQREPPLRQNDFGGTLGGPVHIPHAYNGKDRTFFFFSYEGLRLLQPQPSSVDYVPDQATRQSTAPSMQSVANAFPIANGLDLGDGSAQFIGTWSNPSHINTYSVRLDHAIGQKIKLFFRFGDTDSAIAQREGPSGGGTTSSPAFITATDISTRTYTFGATTVLGASSTNDLRLNFTKTETGIQSHMDDFGGAVVADFRKLSGLNDGNFGVSINFAGGETTTFSLPTFPGVQKQWNLIDTFAFTRGAHTLKVGFDWRRLAPNAVPPPNLDYSLLPGDLTSGNVSILAALNFAPNYALYSNYSSFVQDDWRVGQKLTIALGLRWDLNPPPGASHGILPRTVEGSIPSTLALAPQGTPLWNTQWYNIAPRLGAAYVLRRTSDHETVLRGGVGVFYDTAGQIGGQSFQGPGSLAFALLGSLFGQPVTFPAQASQVVPPLGPVTEPLPSSTYVWGFQRNLQTPYTWQTNLSVQQALGKSQAVTVSYVGGFGRKLLQQQRIQLSNSPNFCAAPCYLLLGSTGLTSNYNSLQTQFQRNLAHGLAALASYTWSHSIDYGSTNVEIPYVRGNSDFDVKHNFSVALSYDLPTGLRNRFAAAVLGHWSLDDRFMARTGFPVTITGAQVYDPATGQFVAVGLDRAQGNAPIYLYGAQCTAFFNSATNGIGPGCPGGRAINPNAFALPAACTSANTCSSSAPGTAPRNFVRGFGAWQMDMAVRREFPIRENLKLEFRSEAFNILNHPNFGTINSLYCSPVSTSPVYSPGCTFGQATQTLAASLSTLSSLYQMGGPRSMQFALKLLF